MLEFGEVSLRVARRASKADPSATLEFDFPAPHHNFILAADADIAAIGAAVDVDIAVVAAFNSGMRARRLAVNDQQLAGRIAP